MVTNLHINAFTQYILTQKRYSAHTVRAYTDDLVQYNTYLQQTYDALHITNVTTSQIRSWLVTLKQAGITAKTINRKLSTLKSFYKYLQKQGHTISVQINYITAPKVERRLPQYVEVSQMHTLLQNMDYGQTYKGVLHQLIVSLFYYTGIRLSELQHLLTANVSITASTIKVLGKGSKERIIPLSSAVLLVMQQYQQAQLNEKILNTTTHYFITENGKPLYAKYIYLVVTKYIGMVTTLSKKSPHVLRHTFATHLTNNGAQLNAVKELLGHSSLAATQIYTHNSIATLKAAHAKAHPKG